MSSSRTAFPIDASTTTKTNPNPSLGTSNLRRTLQRSKSCSTPITRPTNATTTTTTTTTEGKENMGGSAFSKLVEESSTTATPRPSSSGENNRKVRNLTVASGSSEEDTDATSTTVVGNKKNDHDRASPTSVLGWTPETPRNHDHQPNHAVVVQTNNSSLDDEKSPTLVLSSSSSSSVEQQQHSPAPMTGKLQDATEKDVAVVQAIRKESLGDLKHSGEKLLVVSPGPSASVDSPPTSSKATQPPVTVEEDATDNVDTTAGRLEAELAEKKKEIHNLRQFMEKTFKKHHAETLAWKAEKEQLAKAGDEAAAKQVAVVEEGYEKTFALQEQDLAAMKQSLETAQQEKKDLEAAVESAVAQRAKTLANLKKKRELLAQSEAKRTAIQAKLDEAVKTKAHLDQENASLRAGITAVTSVRDEMKMKLRTKNELIREARNEVEVLEKKMAKTERERAMERELLDHYRKLSHHTGYFKWGKPIRQLESTLAESNNNNDA